MSFMSASEIFEPVVRTLVEHSDDDAVFWATRELIRVLTERGWDDVEGSVALFDHPAVLDAANDLGYYADDQIPAMGAMSTAKIRCRACGRRRSYYRDDEGDVHSDVHVTADNELCPYSGKNPRGH